MLAPSLPDVMSQSELTTLIIEAGSVWFSGDLKSDPETFKNQKFKGYFVNGPYLFTQ